MNPGATTRPPASISRRALTWSDSPSAVKPARRAGLMAMSAGKGGAREASTTVPPRTINSYSMRASSRLGGSGAKGMRELESFVRDQPRARGQMPLSPVLLTAAGGAGQSRRLLLVGWGGFNRPLIFLYGVRTLPTL